MTRSLARYQFLAPRVRGALLDVGCGRGYGFELLRSASTSLTGVDLSRPFLSEAREGYPMASFAQSTGERLPFRDATFDTIVSFEVIEHLHDDAGFLDELTRLLRPGGLIALSTPNRLFTSDGREQPINPFHVREYTAPEFEQLLRQRFRQVELFGQQDGTGGGKNHLFDHIPMGWKYLVPTHIQGLISVALRPPLRVADCRFTAEKLERAHTFVALCEP